MYIIQAFISVFFSSHYNGITNLLHDCFNKKEAFSQHCIGIIYFLFFNCIKKCRFMCLDFCYIGKYVKIVKPRLVFYSSDQIMLKKKLLILEIKCNLGRIMQLFLWKWPVKRLLIIQDKSKQDFLQSGVVRALNTRWICPVAEVFHFEWTDGAIEKKTDRKDIEKVQVGVWLT